MDKLRQFLIVFFIVLALFAVIEILPLHFGTRALSWPDIIPEIKSRLPRILLLGVAISLFLTYQSKKKEGTGKPVNGSEQESSDAHD